MHCTSMKQLQQLGLAFSLQKIIQHFWNYHYHHHHTQRKVKRKQPGQQVELCFIELTDDQCPIELLLTPAPQEHLLFPPTGGAERTKAHAAAHPHS